jgi:serine/threonine protein kinase
MWPGWETVRLIGRGSFGGVYEIRRDVFGDTEKAALKVITIPENEREIEELRDEGYDDESITSTFQTHLKSIVAEYSLMRKLNGHTNVVNCDDVRYVQHENGIGWDIFIKMELLTPLKKALDKRVTEEQALRIGKDLCRALILCGKHNIIHRDIKPDNIFVSDGGDCKLGDFGIAKTMEKTSGGTKIGTYDYMAPEVYQGKPYGRTADIYSLGMVLYWLLNERRTPFLPLPPKLPTVTEKEDARLRRFGGEALPAPAHGSEALKAIVLKALSFDPKARYQSAEELLQALEAVGAIHESPVDPGERRFAPVGVGVRDDPKTATNTNGLSRTPAPARETAISEEEATVGVFGTAAPVGATSGRPAVTPAPEPEDATVRAPIARGEDATVGVFGAAKAEKPAPVGADALGGPQKTEPSPEEDGTVSVFGAAKAEKPAPVGADALGGPQKPEQSPDEEATVSAVQRSTPQPMKQEKAPAPARKPEPTMQDSESQPKPAKKRTPLIILCVLAIIALVFLYNKMLLSFYRVFFPAWFIAILGALASLLFLILVKRKERKSETPLTVLDVLTSVSISAAIVTVALLFLLLLLLI